MVDPLSYFSFQPVLHDWCNKGHGMCYPVCGMVHIKEPLLLNGKSSICSGGNGFPLSLSEWLFTICPTPYNRKFKMSLIKHFLPSVWLSCQRSLCLVLKGRKEMFYLTTHSIHFIYGYTASDIIMVKGHSDSDRGNPLPLFMGYFFPISSKGYFICIIPQTR